MDVASTSQAAGAQSERPQGVPPEEITITVLFMFFGSLWVVGTDLLLSSRAGDEWYDTVIYQSTKGLAFVVATGLLLFVTLRRSFARRRRVEEALHLSHERLRITAQVTTDAIYDWDVGTNRLWWSEGFYTQFGYDRAEVEPTLEFWIQQLHPEEREDVLDSLRTAVEGRGATWSCEYRFRRKNGGFAFVHDRACLIRDAEGRATRVIGGMSDISERREGQARLEQSRRQLRALFARLQSLREEERSRIAREIHDELGQLLTALKMDLRWIEKRIGERDTDASLLPLLEKTVEAGAVADRSLSTVQEIASELRPSTLDNLGLVAAIRHEAGKFRDRTGLECDLQLPEDALDLPRDAATAVFRIFQETLTNVARHAKASRVQIRLRAEGDEVVLEVEDNGRGITPEALSSPKSLGLLGMKERAAVLGGEVVVEPGQQRGTKVTFRLPRTASETRFWEQVQI
jgi:PAS domain S-box-containing protein